MLVVQDYKKYRICKVSDLIIISTGNYDEEKKAYKYLIRATDSNYDLGVYYNYKRVREIFDEVKEILKIKTMIEYFPNLKTSSFLEKKTPEEIDELIEKLSCYQFPEE